jgi:amino-acid N-acetyltransferase
MEDVATAVAIALQADKLIFRDRDARHPRAPDEPESEDNPIDTELPLADAERCWPVPPPAAAHRHGVLPAALREGLQGGVERSHIMPFAVDGALLLEVYTHDGIGTMVVDEKLESLREATPTTWAASCS